MKKISMFLAILAVAASCNEQDEPLKKGRIHVNLSQQASTGARIAESSEPVAVRISIRNASGDFVEEQTLLDLHSFGSGYVTQSVELLVGTYTITEFFVLDAEGDIIYATPVEFSEKADYVDDPLPVEFVVSEEETTALVLQVVAVDENNTPEQFGYAYFGFEIIDIPAQPDSIEIDYTAVLNPVYETTGLDSVVITFSKRTEVKIVSTKLIPTSATQALGKIPNNALDLGETPFWPDWKITVKAYYDVIDVVTYIDHVNELITVLPTVPIRHETTRIRIQDSGFSLEDATRTYASYPASQMAISNYAHLIDIGLNHTSAYHIRVNNDLCDPYFWYQLTYRADFMSVSKYVYDGIYEDLKEFTVEGILPGAYQDDVSFAGMCPSDPTSEISASLYMYMYIDETQQDKTCFLVWVDPVSPIDPEYGETLTGGFKIYTPEQYASKLGINQEELLSQLRSRSSGLKR